jgi:ribonuclease P protein component
MSAAPVESGERLPRTETLRASADYQRCYRSGGRRSGRLVTLHFHPGGAPAARLGITVGRKVGPAVARQRLKRWARECFRRHPRRRLLPPLDLVVHFRPGAAESRFADFCAELHRLLAALPAGAKAAAAGRSPA